MADRRSSSIVPRGMSVGFDMFPVGVVGLALGALLVARWLGHGPLGDVPHVQDEQAYWLQAHTLALGRIFTPLAFPRAAFAMWFVDDRWARFGIFPPGWPAALACGIWLHAPFWVNPFLHGATTLLVAVAGHRLGGRKASLVSALLYGFSPQALVLAASLMSHTLIAFAAAIVLVACVNELRGHRSMPWAVCAGGAVGVALLTRPLCACVLAIELAVVMARSARSGGALRTAALSAAPLVPAVVLLFTYNAALTGHATLFPQSDYFNTHLPPVDLPSFRYHPGCNDLGFGPGHGCQDIIRDATHTLGNALSNTGDNLIAWTLLAGGGPLVFVAGVLALRGQSNRSSALSVEPPAPAVDPLLAAPVALVIAAYSLYWYAGTCYGARFYQSALPFLIVLAAVGLARVRSKPVFAALLATFVGWNTLALAKSANELADEYWGNDTRFQRVVDSWTGPKGLVMVAFTPAPAPIRPLFWMTRLLRAGDWLKSQRVGGALALNAPLLDGPVVFAKFHPGLVDDLRARFPDRELWMYLEAPRAEDDVLSRYDGAPTQPLSAPPVENFDGYEMPAIAP